jgi:hypothetical protein
LGDFLRSLGIFFTKTHLVSLTFFESNDSVIRSFFVLETGFTKNHVQRLRNMLNKRDLLRLLRPKVERVERNRSEGSCSAVLGRAVRQEAPETHRHPRTLRFLPGDNPTTVASTVGPRSVNFIYV